MKKLNTLKTSAHETTLSVNICRVLSLMVALIGVVVIFGWYWNLLYLIQIRSNFALMVFNTALGLLLSGSAALMLFFGHRHITFLLSSIVFLIGSLTLWQYITGQDLHIDQLFMQQFVLSKNAYPGRMSFPSALCFTLTAIHLILYCLPLASKTKISLTGLLAPAIIALPLTSVFSYLFSFEIPYGWGNLAGMALHTSIGFIALGAAFITWSLNEPTRMNLLPSVGIALVVMLLALWSAMGTQATQAVREKAEVRNQQIKAAWNEQAEVETKALLRMANLLNGDESIQNWQRDAALYVLDFHFINLIYNQLEPKNLFTPDGATSDLVNELIATFGAKQCNAEADPSIAILNTSVYSGYLLANVIPTKKGCLITAKDFIQRLNSARQAVTPERYPLTVFYDNKPIYHEPSNGDWFVETTLTFHGHVLRLQLTPLREQLTPGILPKVITASGLVISILLLLSLYWAGAARRKSKESTQHLAALRQQEKTSRQVIEMAPNGMIMVDKNGLIELVNAQAEKIFAYSREELLGKSIDMLLPEQYRAQHPQHRGSFFSNPSSRAMGTGRDLFACRKDGREIPVEIGLAPLTFNSGVKILASIVDISERKKAAKDLAEIHHRFTMASNAAGIGFWDWNISTNTLNWDEWMYRLYGRQALEGEQPYALWADSLHPADRTSTEQALNDAVSGIRDYDIEFRIIHPDASVHFIKAKATITRDAKGNAVQMFGVNMDITERKRSEQKQIESANELARINTELNSFAYIASHDLKSPLRGIDQLATWITEDLGDNLNEGTQEHLRLMRSRISRMEMLLDDLLAYSRVGRSEDEFVEINTHTLLEDIFDLTASKKQIKLILADGLPTLKTKKVPLELVFRNLISNAIKHHDKPQGTINISARAINDIFEFTVQDDGPGILPEHQERVFAMFQTLKPRDEVEGSGIGLALVKKAVESMAGRITLESDGKQGCTFRFTWPKYTYKK